jgi:hypothetical protein
VGTDTQVNPDPTLQPDQAEASANQGDRVMVALEWTNGIWGMVLPPGTVKPGQAYQVGLLDWTGLYLDLHLSGTHCRCVRLQELPWHGQCCCQPGGLPGHERARWTLQSMGATKQLLAWAGKGLWHTPD